jgi:hypothetical protein
MLQHFLKTLQHFWKILYQHLFRENILSNLFFKTVALTFFMLINVFENVPTILFFFLRTWWHKGKGGGIGWRQTRGGDADQRHPREGSAGSAVDRAG